MFYCSEQAFYTAWGRGGKKNKQNWKSLHKLKIFKEEFELICEAFFFSFLRKNKGDFYFQAAPISQH